MDCFSPPRMMAIAPNLTIMVGELVGARLIAHAGSLLNLAKHPSSTVQILGAEKALFRSVGNGVCLFVCLCVTMCLVLHVYVGVEPLIQTPMGQKKCPYCNTYKSSTCIWGGKGVLFRSCPAAYSCCIFLLGQRVMT